MARFTESEVEDAALAWLENLGYDVLSGPEIIRSDPGYRDVVLEDSLRQALASLNPTLPPEALEDAFRKITRVDAPLPRRKKPNRPSDAGRWHHSRVSTQRWFNRRSATASVGFRR